MALFSNPTPAQSMSQTLAPQKKNTLLPILLVMVGVVCALGVAAYGYLESRRTETIVIATHTIPFGRQITAADLTTIEVPLHRPEQLTGLPATQLAVGQYATRDITANDLVQPAMVARTPPDEPVYASGKVLHKDMVALPFSTAQVGPLTFRDVLNVGFNDPQGTPNICTNAGGTELSNDAAAQQLTPSGTSNAGKPSTGSTGSTTNPTYDTPATRAFSCLMLERVNVLDVDTAQKIAYLEVTPYQARAIQALQAANLNLWALRYGAKSDPLTPLDRLDIPKFDAAQMVQPTIMPTTGALTSTTTLNPASAPASTVPGANSVVPGTQPTAHP